MSSNDSSSSFASSSFSTNEAKDVGISGRETQALKPCWNYGDSQLHSYIEKQDSTLVKFGKVFQKFSNGISASLSSLTNEAKDASISSQDSHANFDQNSHAISGQDSYAFSGQDPQAISVQESQATSGQDSQALSGQDSQAISGQDSEAISGQDSKAVVRLHWNYGDAHFQPHIEKDGLVFIKFYVPHCKICKETMPLWDKLSEEFEGRVTIGEMDCEGDNLKFCERYKVDAYPTLMLFWHGKPLQEYHGKLDQKSLSNFLNRRLDGRENHAFDWRERYRRSDMHHKDKDGNIVRDL